MVWIKTIDEENAEGALKELYTELTKKRGKVSNILKTHSLLPETMKTHLDLYLSIMFNTSQLNRQEKELIAIIVSLSNRCKYCVQHHAEALHHYWKDPSKLSKLINEQDYSFLLPREQTLATHAEKLTTAPDQIEKDDILLLKDQGFTDEHILEITLIASYFNFVNRIALGLNVECSEEEIKGYHY